MGFSDEELCFTFYLYQTGLFKMKYIFSKIQQKLVLAAKVLPFVWWILVL
jgi:hypothetical protein